MKNNWGRGGNGLNRDGGAYQLSSPERGGGLLEGGGLFERGA